VWSFERSFTSERGSTNCRRRSQLNFPDPTKPSGIEVFGWIQTANFDLIEQKLKWKEILIGLCSIAATSSPASRRAMTRKSLLNNAAAIP
jgi:hypothetical protein